MPSWREQRSDVRLQLPRETDHHRPHPAGGWSSIILARTRSLSHPARPCKDSSPALPPGCGGVPCEKETLREKLSSFLLRVWNLNLKRTQAPHCCVLGFLTWSADTVTGPWAVTTGPRRLFPTGSWSLLLFKSSTGKHFC